MRVTRRWIGITVLLCVCGSPARSQQIAEPMITLDFQNVNVADVLRSLGTIAGREIGWDAPENVEMTLLSAGQVRAGEVIAVSSFAMSLRGLTIVEAAGGGLKVERVAGFKGNCARERADLRRLAAALAARNTARSASIELVDVPADAALHAVVNGLQGVAALAENERPIGTIALSTRKSIPLDEAYFLFASAMEREGNVFLEGPSGSFAVVGCAREPRETSFGGKAEAPRIRGSVVTAARGVALIADSRGRAGGGWSGLELHVDFIDDPLETLLEDDTKLVAIGNEGVTLQRDATCTLLGVGEHGAGRSVECPLPRSNARMAK